MTMLTIPELLERIEYPDRDGLPMSDNTLQWYWMVLIKECLEALFADDPNVFVAGNLLWYPVQGDNRLRAAPDVFVAIGRPKGYRGSYKQWVEGNQPPQVVFEINSPGNTATELAEKIDFYDDHGVEEFYFYDPDRDILRGYYRDAGIWQPIPLMQDWVSPRFDEVFFVDLPTVESRMSILSIQFTRRGRDPSQFDLAELAAAAEGFTGGELEQAIIGGLYAAFQDGVELTDQHVLTEMSKTRPLSVLMGEKITELREWANGRCVSAD